MNRHKHAQSGTRRTRLLALCLFGSISHLTGGAGAGEYQPEFTEPYSGARVASYQLTLPLGGRQDASYTIPGDCERLLRATTDRARRNQRILERRLWHKARADCRYHAMLTRHATAPAITDHLSGMDFKNMSLNSLPLAIDCDALGQAAGSPPCTAWIVDLFGQRRPFPIGPLPGDDPTDSTSCDCRLRDGLFRGGVLVYPIGLRCRPSQHGPGLRLQSVDRSDINGDGIMDAVLRFMPVGTGRHRRPLFLPVTRFSADGAISPAD